MHTYYYNYINIISSHVLVLWSYFGVFVLVAWISVTLISCHSVEPLTGKHANTTNNFLFVIFALLRNLHSFYD